MSNDKYPQFTKDRLIEIATQALHRLIEVDNEAACELIKEELDLSFDEMKFFEVFDTMTHSLYSEIDEELALIDEIETESMTVELLQEKIKTIIKENYYSNEDGGIEMYLDYRDELSNKSLYEIMSSDNPREAFNEIMAAWTIDGENYYIPELYGTIRQNLSDEEIEFYEANEDEIKEWIQENYYLYYDENHFNNEVNVNIMLDTGNCNYDFTCDNVLNYYSDSREFDESSSILWLSRQQGKENELKEAVKQFEPGYYEDEKWIGRTENTDAFIESVIQELENLPSHMGTLTFLVKMKLFDYFELREAMAAEEKLNNDYDVSEREGTGYIVLGKQTECGLFDPWSGGGSCLEIELDKDVVLPLKCIFAAEIETGKSQYGYSVDCSYGLCDYCWKDTVKEIKPMNEDSNYGNDN